MSHKIHNHGGSILYVSSDNQSEVVSARVGDPERPYPDPWAARTAAVSGDLIYVFSGIYIISSVGGGGDITIANGAESASKAVLLKEGIKFYFEPGCVISDVSSLGAALFGDFVTAITNCEIRGHLSFNHTTGGQWPATTIAGGNLYFEFDEVTHSQTNAPLFHIKSTTNTDIYIKIRRHIMNDTIGTDYMKLLDLDGTQTGSRVSIEVDNVQCVLGQVFRYTNFEGSMTDCLINLKIKNADIISKAQALFEIQASTPTTGNVFNREVDNVIMQDPRILDATYAAYTLDSTTITEDSPSSTDASELPSLIGLGNSWGGSAAVINNNQINIKVGNADLSGVLLGRMFGGPNTGLSTENNHFAVTIGNIISRNGSPCFLPIATNGTAFFFEDAFKCVINLLGRAIADNEVIWGSSQTSHHNYEFQGGTYISRGTGTVVVNTTTQAHSYTYRGVILINDGVAEALASGTVATVANIYHSYTNSLIASVNILEQVDGLTKDADVLIP